MTRGAKPVPTEQAEHRAFIQWLRLQPATLFWATIDHGQRISQGQVRKAKARGYVAGVPDVIGCHRGRFWAVEMKRTKGGSLSAEQKDMHRRITLAGGVVFTAKGAQAAIDFVRTNILATQQMGHGT